MTVAVYPLDAVAGSPEYSGRMLRDTLAALLGGATSARPLGAFSGVRPGTSPTTVTLSGTTWTCGTFAGVLDVQAAAEAGPYLFAITASEAAVLNAANAANPRVDILSVQLSDPAESDGTLVPKGELVYTAGAAAGSPVAPATPARSMKVAEFSVPKAGTGDPTVTWVAPVLFAAGGIAQVSSVPALAGLPSRDGSVADVLTTPGAIWRYSLAATAWLMHGIAQFADSTAASNAIASPVQGMRRKRANVGYVEQYFGLYNAGTNPGGATAAGWYPVSGVMPAIIVTDSATQTVSTLAVITAWATTEYQSVLPSPVAGVFTPGIAGRYAVSAFLKTSATASTASYIELRKNAVSLARSSDGGSAAGNGSWLSAETEVVLAASDTLSLAALRSSSGSVSDRRMTIRYLGPA